MALWDSKDVKLDVLTIKPPKAEEVLWVTMEDGDWEDIDILRRDLEKLVLNENDDVGYMMVSNFVPEIEVMTRDQMEMLYAQLHSYISIGHPASPAVQMIGSLPFDAPVKTLHTGPWKTKTNLVSSTFAEAFAVIEAEGGTVKWVYGDADALEELRKYLGHHVVGDALWGGSLLETAALEFGHFIVVDKDKRHTVRVIVHHDYHHDEG